MARTLNNCSHCGHEWRTRGEARVSARCPACGSRQTHYDLGDGHYLVAALVAGLIGIGGAVAHGGPCPLMEMVAGDQVEYCSR